MLNYPFFEDKSPAKLSFPYALLIAVALGVAGARVQPCRAQEPEKEGMGAILSGKAGPGDVGLPLYPGSRPHKDKPNDSQGARLGLWGGGSGFKLAVMKMESNDSPEKVAAFYKKALAKYGKVLDCSNPSSAPSEAGNKEDSKALTCDDEKPNKGDMVFKSGTKEKQHIVAIQPYGRGSVYQLVALGNWGDDKN